MAEKTIKKYRIERMHTTEPKKIAIEPKCILVLLVGQIRSLATSNRSASLNIQLVKGLFYVRTLHHTLVRRASGGLLLQREDHRVRTRDQ